MHIRFFDFLSDLLRIDTVAPHEDAILNVLCQFIRTHLPYDQLLLQPVSTGRHNLIVTRGAPRTTLTSHLDTVPKLLDVFEDSGRIYGRGACDAKGQIVAQLWALIEAAHSGLGDYAAFWVVGEEVDSAGAQAVIAHPAIGSPFLINGEPTGMTFVNRSRGVVTCEICAEGIAQHSSLGSTNSAMHKLIVDLEQLLRPHDRLMVNVGAVTGGGAPNVTVKAASASLCVRFDGTSNSALDFVRSTLRNSALTVQDSPIESFDFHVPSAFCSSATKVSFCSDAPLYASRFQRVMMFGPGDIEYAHTDNEHIKKEDVVRAKDVLLAVIR